MSRIPDRYWYIVIAAFVLIFAAVITAIVSGFTFKLPNLFKVTGYTQNVVNTTSADRKQTNSYDVTYWIDEPQRWWIKKKMRSVHFDDIDSASPVKDGASVQLQYILEKEDYAFKCCKSDVRHRRAVILAIASATLFATGVAMLLSL